MKNRHLFFPINDISNGNWTNFRKIFVKIFVKIWSKISGSRISTKWSPKRLLNIRFCVSVNVLSMDLFLRQCIIVHELIYTLFIHINTRLKTHRTKKKTTTTNQNTKQNRYNTKYWTNNNPLLWFNRCSFVMLILIVNIA